MPDATTLKQGAVALPRTSAPLKQSPNALEKVRGVIQTIVGDAEAAIDDKWRSLGGAPGGARMPGARGLIRVGSTTFFREYENGRIYHAAETVWVHGAILQRYLQLGGPGGWLGLPRSDEQDFPDDGKVTAFQNGSIYWWADTGARDINNVVVHYTGVHCFGETDVDGGSPHDEPYATLGVAAPDGTKQTFRSQIYEGVDAGEGRFEVIEIYRGKPHGLTIGSILQEHSAGDTELSRSAMTEAVDKAGPALAQAAKAIPTVGPVLGPLVSLAHQMFRKDLIGALNAFIEGTLGFADRPLGSDLIELTPKQMIVLATQHPAQFGPIPWKFETALLERSGASYKAYFNIFPA